MGFSAFEMLRCCLCSFVFLRFFCDVLFCCMSFGFDRLFLRVYFEEETLSLCFVDLSSILLPRRRVFVRIFSVFLSLILAVCCFPFCLVSKHRRVKFITLSLFLRYFFLWLNSLKRLLESIKCYIKLCFVFQM